MQNGSIYLRYLVAISAESSLAADLEDSITSATSTRLNLSKTSGPVEVRFASLQFEILPWHKKDILGGENSDLQVFQGASYEF